jgi:hypothetical protein
MSGENQCLITNETVEVRGFTRINDHFRGMYRIYLESIKQNQQMSTCNQLDLGALGS